MTKLPDSDIKQLAIEVASGVDWTRVANVMEYLDWKHWDSKEYQTHQDLLLKAVKQIEYCVYEMYNKGLTRLTTGSGGIMASCELNDEYDPDLDEPAVFVKVWFELDSWDNLI